MDRIFAIYSFHTAHFNLTVEFKKSFLETFDLFSGQHCTPQNFHAAKCYYYMVEQFDFKILNFSSLDLGRPYSN